MAGKPKKGISFAGWNVDIFENDTKIDQLIDAQGWIGFSIYFYLCQRAYASDGYFYRWSYANAATTARRMGGGIGSETVKQVVSTCLRIGLFDKRLFDKEGILTSRGIQRNYMEAIQKRSYKEVNYNYWLLPDDECKGSVVLRNLPHSLPEDAHSLPEDVPNSRVNKSKVNKSKGEYTAPAVSSPKPTAPTLEEVCKLNKELGNHADPVKFYEYYSKQKWMYKGAPMDWAAKLKQWNDTERKDKQHTTTAVEYEATGGAFGGKIPPLPDNLTDLI